MAKVSELGPNVHPLTFPNEKSGDRLTLHSRGWGLSAFLIWPELSLYPAMVHPDLFPYFDFEDKATSPAWGRVRCIAFTFWSRPPPCCSAVLHILSKVAKNAISRDKIYLNVQKGMKGLIWIRNFFI